MGGKGITYSLLVGVQACAAIVKIIVEVPEKSQK